jgi:hypothetical protein
MTKVFLFAFLSVLLLAAPGFTQQTEKASNSGRSIPTYATIEIVLVDAPGINIEESRWNITYEIRIASDAALWESHKRNTTNDSSGERVGELIKEESLKQTLRSAANRTAVLTIPLSSEIQERLRNQPSSNEVSRIGLTSKESGELEARAQNISFYSVVEIYDAKLKKNIIFPIARIWSLIGLTNAPLEITVQINAEGGYKWNSSKHRPAMEIIKKHE